MITQADPEGTWRIFTSPLLAFLVLGGYLVFVLKLGPKLMENRSPYDLRGVIKIYNLMQIVYNGLLLCTGIYFVIIMRAFDRFCLSPLPPDHQYKEVERLTSNLYMLNKFFDLVETIFFVLRKKNKQISGLHVIHHFSMAFIGFLYINIHGSGGPAILGCFLNVCVHVFMYVYYFRSLVNPNMQGSFWWKKYITIGQMVQFLINLIFYTFAIVQPNCNASRTVMVLGLIMNGTYLTMFTHFYINNYILPAKKKSEKQAQ